MLKNIVITLALTTSLFGADRVFVPAPGQSSIAFELPYTAGIVKGTAKVLEGRLMLDAKNVLQSGRLSVPLTAVLTGNETRDCHMREAMGIDYTNSAFPGQHVCNQQNQTPPTGPNSVVFPNIEFEFTALTLIDGAPLPEVLEEGRVNAINLQGRFTIHGKTNTAQMIGQLKETAGVLTLTVNFPVKLADYGIVVKTTLGTTMGAASNVKLNLNLAKEVLE